MTRPKVAPLAWLAVLAVVVTSVFFGRFQVSLVDLVAMLRGEVIPGASVIVMEGKVPRALLGALAGVGFGVAGSLFQSLLRNPLASPDIIGIASGASVSAVIAIVVLGWRGAPVSLVAMIGALVVAGLMLALAAREGLHGNRLVLVGIGTAAALQSVITFLFSRSDLRTAADALVWTTGSLAPANWERVAVLGAALAVLLPLTALLRPALRALELGDDAAVGLGLAVTRWRVGGVVVGVLLAAACTAATGPISFIAFLAGSAARRLTRSGTAFGTAAAVGALLVVGADFVAANALADSPFPVGALTGALGAPFLLWLLAADDRKESA
ncbi:FecCD family ABC transporter permease [Janibacter sp. G56]|uniref:FecCD family ABC transporter permease n=1 Tax=Janibacter sp. G56 TaxID=3418717 RepID=UPI003D0846B7